MTKYLKKGLVFVIALAMVMTCFSAIFIQQIRADDSAVAGVYEGSSTTATGTVYNHKLTLNTDGSYTCFTSYSMTIQGQEYNNTETETGSYAVSGENISFTGGTIVQEPDMMGSGSYSAAESTATVDTDGNLTAQRHASYMAQTMGKDQVSIQFKKTESFESEPEKAEDLLESGKYEMSAAMGSFNEASDKAHWHEAIFTVDAGAKTIHTIDKKTGAEKGTGTYVFDPEVNVYTLTYTADTTGIGNTVRFNYADGAITFTEAISFGAAKLFLEDGSGNFTPYTAYRNDAAMISKPEEEKPDVTGKLIGKAEVKNEGYEPKLSWDNYNITVAVETDENGKLNDIIYIEHDGDASRTSIPRFAKQIIDGVDGTKGLKEQLGGKTPEEILAMTESDVDVIAGATCSTRGILAAVQEAVKGITSEPKKLSEGTYYGHVEKTTDMGSKSIYNIKALFEDGKYTYSVRTTLPSMDYDEAVTASGEYTETGSGIEFSDDKELLKSGTVVDENTLNIKGRISNFAFSDSEFVLTKNMPEGYSDPDDASSHENDPEKEDDPKPDSGNEKVSDELQSGTYELTEDSYDDSAQMKMPADIEIDTEANTFKVIRKDNGQVRGEGSITFDEEKGEYTLNYSDGENKTSTFTYDADKKAITFTSPLWFGPVRMNVTDENDNFIPYTAKLKSDDAPAEEPAPKAPDYRFVEGGNGTIAQGSASDYTLRVRDMANKKGEFAKFRSVEIDGTVLDGTNYEASEGSVIIKLKGDYVKSLKEGEHKVKVNMTDGSAETNLTVKAVKAADDGNKDNTALNNAGRRTTNTGNAGSARTAGNSDASRTTRTAAGAKTGDTSNTAGYSLAIAAAAGVFIAVRKKQSADNK